MGASEARAFDALFLVFVSSKKNDGCIGCNASLRCSGCDKRNTLRNKAVVVATQGCVASSVFVLRMNRRLWWIIPDCRAASIPKPAKYVSLPRQKRLSDSHLLML